MSAIARLQQRGWSVVTVWECALRLDPAAAVNATADLIHEGGGGNRHVEALHFTPEGKRLVVARR